MFSTRPQLQANSLPIPEQETQCVQQGPQQQANSLPIPGQETHGAENNNLDMLQHSSPQGMGNFVNSFEGRLQVNHAPSDISSVFNSNSSLIPVKIKERI